jgi:ring-1,2-phenylacetyl-CoA epoxidase subunit PaaD
MVTSLPPATRSRAALDDVRRQVEAVLDPELPVVTLGQLGIVRSVSWSAEASDTVVVEITPTYSGCPAMEVIGRDVASAVATFDLAVEVSLVLAPAWTTDWISVEGRNALRQAGIAPPGPARPRSAGPVLVELGRGPERAARPSCPQCGADEVEELARFGSTSCKSLWRCLACREPFDHLKPL